MRDLTYCHDDGCERAEQCLRFRERLSRAWASHALTLRPVGGRGRECEFFIAAPTASRPPAEDGSDHSRSSLDDRGDCHEPLCR